MGLSDEQLMLLEQLTYADKNLFNELGINYSSPTQVLEKIKNLSYDDIYALSNKKEINNHTMTGKEWADILFAIKSDPDIMDLKCTNYDDKAKGYCFVSSSGEAYVAFRGTSGPYEWKDDAEGLALSDTPCQEWALNFVEGLPYNNIAVVGHSKGGNKAQYVTIVSDKVDRCVSMDGQGFSKEFIDKYWAEIEQKGCKIKNYSYKSDYVHILLNPVPGSEQIYCDGGNTGKECHNPNGMIKIEYKDKKWNVSYTRVEENSAMTYLHGFTCFVANNMPLSERKQVGEFLGIILAITLGNGEYIINGVKYNSSNVTDFIKNYPDIASTVIAYLMKYVDVYHVSKEDAFKLFEMLGIEGITAEIIWEIIDAKDLDGEHDFSYYFNLLTFRSAREEMAVFSIDAAFFGGIITNAKIKRNQIDVNPNTARDDYESKKTEVKRNFTNDSLNVIINAIKLIDSGTVEQISTWNRFTAERWFEPIFAGVALRGIAKYFEKLHSVNYSCKKQICKIYRNVQALDRDCSSKIQNHVDELRHIRKKIENLNQRIW